MGPLQDPGSMGPVQDPGSMGPMQDPGSMGPVQDPGSVGIYAGSKFHGPYAASKFHEPCAGSKFHRLSIQGLRLFGHRNCCPLLPFRAHLGPWAVRDRWRWHADIMEAEGRLNGGPIEVGLYE